METEVASKVMEVPQTVYTLDWAAMSPADQRAFFSRNGFLVVPSAFDAAELEVIHREIKQFGLEDAGMDMMDAFCKTPSFAPMIDNPKIIGAVRAALGDDVICFKGAYVPKKSKEKGRPYRTALHMDYGIGESEADFRNSNALWVNVACYLSDMTFEHAPFAVVPGSNTKYYLTPGTDLEELSDEAVTVLVKAGDALVFLHNTVHAGGVNVSGETQHILFTSYRSAWARPIGRVIEWPKDFVEKAPPSRRALIEQQNRGRWPLPKRKLGERLREFVS